MAGQHSAVEDGIAGVRMGTEIADRRAVTPSGGHLSHRCLGGDAGGEVEYRLLALPRLMDALSTQPANRGCGHDDGAMQEHQNPHDWQLLTRPPHHQRQMSASRCYEPGDLSPLAVALA